ILNMTITKCQKCDREISDDIDTCPYCGVISPTKKEDNGPGFEWQTNATVYGYPLIHIAFGKDARGKLRVARGIIAIGQFGIGLITIAQFGVGILFGFGQFILGLTTIAQFAIGILFGLGQFSTGYIAIGQIAFGWYSLCQLGYAKYLWTPKIKDPQAIEFFRQLWERISHLIS
ncbi:MAG: hypothetical protein ACUVQ4_01735, partial [bacterium]